jgi:hypothetical protein
MMIVSVDKHQIKNDHVYFYHILCVVNLIHVVLEYGNGENKKCMMYIDF